MSLLIASVYSQASLRARRGWVGGWGVLESHRYTTGEGPRETRSERDFSPMSGEKKMFLQYNSADRQRHFNICL